MLFLRFIFFSLLFPMSLVVYFLALFLFGLTFCLEYFFFFFLRRNILTCENIFFSWLSDVIKLRSSQQFRSSHRCSERLRYYFSCLHNLTSSDSSKMLWFLFRLLFFFLFFFFCFCLFLEGWVWVGVSFTDSTLLRSLVRGRSPSFEVCRAVKH